MIAPFFPPLHVVVAPKLLECPPRCGSLDHATDAANTISRWPLVDDDPHMPKVRVPAKQPRDIDAKRGLAIPSARSTFHRVLGKYPAF
jgi:hypothetical protein